MFVKYFTSEQFNKEEFRDMLVQKCNVRCAVVGDGLIINLDDFNDIEFHNLPIWAQMNKADINNPLHTRPATEQEYQAARLPRYGIYSYATTSSLDLVLIFVEDDYAIALDVMNQWHNITHRTTLLIDTTTGEVVTDRGLTQAGKE